MDTHSSAELKIDHIVVLVNDLQASIADYSSLGFTVMQGGEHADGVSHNALIAFEDGAYLELIAFRRPAPERHLFAVGAGRGEGFIAYALLPANIEATLSGARFRGLDISGPFPGGRVRPDGVQVKWQTGTASTPDLPFLCADVTPRERRVPSGGAQQHGNGITGVLGITVVVNNIEASTERYYALLGREPLPDFGMPATEERIAAFQLDTATITLIQPERGPLRDYLEARGEGPYSAVLCASTDLVAGYLNLAATHSARFEVVHELARNQGS